MSISYRITGGMNTTLVTPQLLGQNTVTKAIYKIKFIGFHSFRGKVHDHGVRKHSSRQAKGLLEK